MKDKYDLAIDAVVSKLEEKKGFDHFWGRIDEDIQEDIREDLATVIRKVLE